jgi:hypothetical protein
VRPQRRPGDQNSQRRDNQRATVVAIKNFVRLERGLLGWRNNGVDTHLSGSNEVAFGTVGGALMWRRAVTGGNWAARGKRRISGSARGEQLVSVNDPEE